MMAQPSDDDINTVIDIIGVSDWGLVRSALQAKNNSIEAVMNDYFDSPESFKSKYGGGWDETAFSSGREGDKPTGINGSNNPSFSVFPAPDDNQVIYGTEPYYGPVTAPSRPPSRVNNRSPIGRMVDMTTGELAPTAPNNQHEDDALLQRAISASLQTSGVQSPQGLPPPPPQQTGVTSSGDSGAYFGPANRTDYKPEEWAMVPAKRREDDPDAALRKRSPDTPVFLRCRDENWGSHRVGAILTILHSIPAARNALLRAGVQADYGYGSNPSWWKGEKILSPDREAAKVAAQGDLWASEVYPLWTDELHRLMAFLDSTERSYGTADTLAKARSAEDQIEDVEKGFFDDLSRELPLDDAVFRTTVDIVSVSGDPSLTTQSAFTCIDSQYSKESLALAETLYSIWDMIFYTDIDVSNDDPEAARIAMITQPSDVIIFRFAGPDRCPTVIGIPETFYIDRYLESNRDKMLQIQKDIARIHAAYNVSRDLEKKYTEWINPSTGFTCDRRVMGRAGIKRCQELIDKIRNRAFWRDHEGACARRENDDFYLLDHDGDPNLSQDEAEVVTYYEAKIKDLEANIAKIDHVVNELILPRRKTLERYSRHLSSLLTAPSAEEQWNAKHKYTLRGVVNNWDKLFIRRRETSLLELEDGAVASEQWWKLSCESENGYKVSAEMTMFETAMREACGIDTRPILIYATDKAMDETPDPLSEALKIFIKFDNRHFKQELSQAEQERTEQPDIPPNYSHLPEYSQLQDLSHLSTLRAAGLHLKKKRSTGSMDSMATNEASVGSLEGDMRDAPFEQDDISAGQLDFGNVRLSHAQSMSDLVDVSVGEDVHMDQAVSVEEIEDAAPQEMQERGNASLVTRLGSGALPDNLFGAGARNH